MEQQCQNEEIKDFIKENFKITRSYSDVIKVSEMNEIKSQDERVKYVSSVKFNQQLKIFYQLKQSKSTRGTRIWRGLKQIINKEQTCNDELLLIKKELEITICVLFWILSE